MTLVEFDGWWQGHMPPHMTAGGRQATREEWNVSFTCWFSSDQTLGMGRFGATLLLVVVMSTTNHPNWCFKDLTPWPPRIPLKFLQKWQIQALIFDTMLKIRREDWRNEFLVFFIDLIHLYMQEDDNTKIRSYSKITIRLQTLQVK